MKRQNIKNDVKGIMEFPTKVIQEQDELEQILDNSKDLKLKLNKIDIQMDQSKEILEKCNTISESVNLHKLVNQLTELHEMIDKLE